MRPFVRATTRKYFLTATLAITCLSTAFIEYTVRFNLSSNAHSPENAAGTPRVEKALRQQPDEYECVERIDNNSLKVFLHGPRFGRLGNVFAALFHLIVFAQRAGCHVELPRTLLGLDGAFESRCHIFALRSSKKASICPNHTGSEWFRKGYWDERGVYYLNETFTESEKELARDVLRKYTGTNSTHAYNEPCQDSPDVAVHLRAGDIVSGSYNSLGQLVATHASNAVKRRAPFPTAFYVKALQKIITEDSDVQVYSQVRIHVLAQDAQNPTSLFFEPLVSGFPNLSIYYERDLLRDLVDMSCSKHLVTSRSTLHHATALRQAQKRHYFVDNLTTSSDCANGNFYYSFARGGTDYLALLCKWTNSEQNRSLINARYAIQLNACKTSM